MSTPEKERPGELAQDNEALRAEVQRLRQERDQADAARDAIIREVLPLSGGAKRPSGQRARRLGMLLLCLILLGASAGLIARFTSGPGAEPAAESVVPDDLSASTTRRPGDSFRPRRLAVIPVPGLGAIASAALAADGRRVALADRAGRAVIFSLATDQVLARLAPQSALRALAFAADGRLLGGGEDGSVRCWSPAGRPLEPLRTVGSPVRDLATNGGLLAVAGEAPTIELLSLADGAERRSIESGSEWVRALAFSPDGRWLAAGGHQGAVRLFDVASGRPAASAEGHGLWISALAFGPRGRRLASAGFDKSVRVWTVSATGALRQQQLLRGHVRRAVALAFSPAGTLLASAGLDRRALLWDVARGRLAHELEGHDWQISAVAFDPRGRFLLTAGGDGTLRVWPLPPPISGALAALPPPGPGEVTFRSNTSGERQRIRLVDEAGELRAEGRRGLARVLRSGPDDATTAIDPRLARLIYRIAEHFGREHEVVVISGFRSPRYNRLRTRQSSQVAEKSRHLRGEAADLRIDGVSITALRDYVTKLGAGGVGFYADSKFVHVDVGPVRQWTGD